MMLEISYYYYYILLIFHYIQLIIVYLNPCKVTLYDHFYPVSYIHTRLTKHCLRANNRRNNNNRKIYII